ncbi:unnamed protein product, partial [Larinioides sclopetarius]
MANEDAAGTMSSYLVENSSSRRIWLSLISVINISKNSRC